MASKAPIRARYSNFDIRIEERGTSYRAVVVDSPAGEASSDFDLPFSEDRLENLVLKISGSIGAAQRQTRRIGSAQRRQVEEIGSALFDALFNGEVKDVFDRSRERTGDRGAGLRIRLRLGDAPALINIPWEYLYDRARNEFLALSPDTPLYRYAELQRTALPLRVAPPLRVLVMVSQPSDVSELSGGIEWERLQGELGDLTRRGLVEPALVKPATRAALESALKEQPCHILHFIGHGGFDEDSDDGGLIFEGKHRRSVLVTGRDLGIALGPFRSLRLVVLNACEGARVSLKDPFGGAAQALVRQGIPAVVAMQFEVTDAAAVTFARAFYERIALQDPIDVALGWARRAIFADENEVEWATPVLYLRSPTGRIFAHGAQEPGLPEPEPPIEPPVTAEPEPDLRVWLNKEFAGPAPSLEEEARKAESEARKRAEEEEARKAESEARKRAEEEEARKAESRRRRLRVFAVTAVLIGAVVAGIVWFRGQPDTVVPPHSLFRIDPVTHAALDVIPNAGVEDFVGTDLRARDDSLWVLGTLSVVRVNSASGQAIATIPLDGPSADFGAGGSGRTGGVWVIHGDNLSQIDESENELGDPVDIGLGSPRRLAVGGYVWVLAESLNPSADAPNMLVQLDNDGAVRRTLHLRGIDIAVSDEGVWVADKEGSQVLRIDPDPESGETPSAIIPVSDPPDGITAYEGAVWIFNTAMGTVTRVDPNPDLNEADAADDPIPIHHRPIAIRPGLGAAWTVNEDGTITRIRPGVGPETLKVEAPVAAFTVDQPHATLWAVAR